MRRICITLEQMRRAHQARMPAFSRKRGATPWPRPLSGRDIVSRGCKLYEAYKVVNFGMLAAARDPLVFVALPLTLTAVALVVVWLNLRVLCGSRLRWFRLRSPCGSHPLYPHKTPAL